MIEVEVPEGGGGSSWRSLALVLAMDEIDGFVRDYSSKDRDRVLFASNGKLGPELRDANIQHRLAVCDRLRKTSAAPASDELIRELYDAETAWAKAAWCVRHDTVSFLAAELLTRGGDKNVRHYLQCMFRGQDAYLSSLCIKLSPEVRSKVLATIDELIKSEGPSAPAIWQNIRAGLARDPAAT